ncbi:MAG: hypothetical protein NXI04_17165 [Planctomycetaceae bacterium]|nr:hypothetical protein [Planctomycetaceae bacterium]
MSAALLCLMVVSRLSEEAAPGLQGYCPVTVMDDHKWQKGSTEYSVLIDGVRYQFTSEARRTNFLENVDRYCPVLHGNCITCLVDSDRKVSGKIKFGLFFEDRFFLFPTQESREKFSANTPRYSRSDIVENGDCPVSIYKGNRQKGDRKFTWMYRGYRVRLSSAQALEQFRKDPSKYLMAPHR